MALRPKAQIGTMECLCCGEKIPVRKAENGTLNFSCNWCEFPGYAKAGTDAHSHIMSRVNLLDVPAPAPEPVPAAAPKSAAAKSRNTIFGV
jgi:hypothetical protein